VHHLVPSGTHETYQPPQRGHIAVAPHAEIHDAGAARLDGVGDQAAVLQGHDVGLMSGVAKQQLQLPLGSSRRESGDDMQDLHRWRPTVCA